MAESVINCEPDSDSIAKALAVALEKDCSKVINPYGDGNSSVRIKDILKKFAKPSALLKKRFFDLAVNHD